MTDVGSTIAPKSDQMNADDLIAGPRTITVREVKKRDGDEQPISIYFEGDQGKPFKPCKSMRRVLVQQWGRDGSQYVGKSMTLFRDPEVAFGGAMVGGIRISHLSDIDGDQKMSLTVSRAQRKPYTVRPLKMQERTRPEEIDVGAFAKAVADKCAEATSADDLKAWANSDVVMAKRNAVKAQDPDRATLIRTAIADRIGELSTGGEV